jgi:hypothetical protein
MNMAFVTAVVLTLTTLLLGPLDANAGGRGGGGGGVRGGGHLSGFGGMRGGFLMANLLMATILLDLLPAMI